MNYIITQMVMLVALWMMMYILKFKKKMSMKTMSPFECGYNTMSPKLPLSIQFTLLIFLFLLFDIELSILISSNLKLSNLNKSWVITMLGFLLSISISIMYEMVKKSLKWN